MRFLYISPDPVAGPARAQALGCGWVPSVPAGFTATPPCVILAGGDPYAVTVIAEPTTAAAVASAAVAGLAQEAADLAAQATAEANLGSIEANVQTHLTALETFIAANPTGVAGSALTAAQVNFLLRTVDGLGRILLGLLSSVGQS